VARGARSAGVRGVIVCGTCVQAAWERPPFCIVLGLPAVLNWWMLRPFCIVLRMSITNGFCSKCGNAFFNNFVFVSYSHALSMVIACGCLRQIFQETTELKIRFHHFGFCWRCQGPSLVDACIGIEMRHAASCTFLWMFVQLVLGVFLRTPSHRRMFPC